MKKISYIFSFFILQTICSQSSLAEYSLNCQFGIYGTTILTTRTVMENETTLGSWTEFTFPGTPAKKLDNKILTPKEGQLFYFQLDEGQEEKNISVTVDKKVNSDGSHTGFAENPQSPMMKRMDGSCLINKLAF